MNYKNARTRNNWGLSSNFIRSIVSEYSNTGEIKIRNLGMLLSYNLINQPIIKVDVIYVQPGSVAEKAGIKRGDWILAIDDFPLKSEKDFFRAVKCKNGHNLTI